MLRFLSCFAAILFCGLFASCENPWMVKILEPKTVFFETNGGSKVESQTVYRDYPVKRPSNPVRSGYTFDAWYSDNETFVSKWNFDTVPNADITLYAKWNDETGSPGLVYELINGNTAYRVSQGTATGDIVIPAYRLYNGNDLPVTTISNGIDTWGNGAFSVFSINGGSKNPNITVTSITFAAGNRLTTISDCAFFYCPNLTDITIPVSVTSIGSCAFEDCTGLTSITIPAGVTDIGGAAFYQCSSLASVTFAGTIPSSSFAGDAFSSIGDLRTKYLAGGIGTYTRSGSGTSATWTKQ
jgi:uncharacterized repeat protein (TIGR02543 family)